MTNKLITYLPIIILTSLLTGCIDTDLELKSFYKMSCEELLSKQVEIKEDLDSNSFGVILGAIFDENQIENDSRQEENSLKRDLRDVQRAIYDRKCEWNTIK